MAQFDTPDRRCIDPRDYEEFNRRGRMKRSWEIGVQRQTDGKQMISFEDGLSWGSIGQILGYLLGQVDEGFQDDLYEKLLAQYKLTDRGKPLR
jgi:hypothetical protein